MKCSPFTIKGFFFKVSMLHQSQLSDFSVCKRIQVLTKSIAKRIICFFRFIHFVYKLNLSLRAMYMNVTIYCCKRGVKHRIKDVLHSTQSITVDEMETDLNTYSFLTC